MNFKFYGVQRKYVSFTCVWCKKKKRRLVLSSHYYRPHQIYYCKKCFAASRRKLNLRYHNKIIKPSFLPHPRQGKWAYYDGVVI